VPAGANFGYAKGIVTIPGTVPGERAAGRERGEWRPPRWAAGRANRQPGAPAPIKVPALLFCPEHAFPPSGHAHM